MCLILRPGCISKNRYNKSNIRYKLVAVCLRARNGRFIAAKDKYCAPYRQMAYAVPGKWSVAELNDNPKCSGFHVFVNRQAAHAYAHVIPHRRRQEVIFKVEVKGFLRSGRWFGYHCCQGETYTHMKLLECITPLT